MNPDDPITGLLADLAAETGPAPARDLLPDLLAAARLASGHLALPAPVDLPPAARPYLRQVLALTALVEGPAADRPATPVVNGWTAAQVLAHLTAVDALAAQALGLPAPAETGTGVEVQARTDSLLAALDPTDLPGAAALWRRQCNALLRFCATGDQARMQRPVRYLGIPLSAPDVLLDRAFETWIHAEDLRRALGLEAEPPAADDLHTLSDLGARLLDLTWPEPADGPVLALELTGPGGGVWSVPRGATGARASGPAPAGGTVVLDAVDFCRLAGGRLDPDAVPHTGDAHPEQARRLLGAVAALARL